MGDFKRKHEMIVSFCSVAVALQIYLNSFISAVHEHDFFFPKLCPVLRSIFYMCRASGFFKCISVDFQVQGGDWAVNVPAAVTTQLKT